MNLESIREHLKGVFRPFVIRTSAGREFEVPWPGCIAIGKSDIAIVDQDGVIHIVDGSLIGSITTPPLATEAGAVHRFAKRWLNRMFVEDVPTPEETWRGAGPHEYLSNFTPRAQQVLALARKEAERFNHNFVGTEHVLLGLLGLGQGVAVTVIRRLGVDIETVRLTVVKEVGTGPDQKIACTIPYTPRVKRVLSLAVTEAQSLKHHYVGTEHILLGLLLEGDGVAGHVLKSLDVDAEQTRQEILKELDPNFGRQKNPSGRAGAPPDVGP